MYLNILHNSSSETVQMVFFYDYVVNIICVLFSNSLCLLLIKFLNSVVKILNYLLFKFIHQPDAICYLYMPCLYCHLNIMMLSDT